MSAIGMKITNFHYANATFEKPAEFVEYPKWIHMSGYPSEIVQDREGEDRLLARPVKSVDVTVELESAKAEAIAQPVVEIPSDATPGIIMVESMPIEQWMTERRDHLQQIHGERDALIRTAHDRNIKIDARWKTDRIRETIEKAG